MFLIAALAAVIPVLLHLINRQRAPVMPYSTLRFLRVSVRRTRRRKYVHDVLLLLLRVAALVLIALGLARPTIRHFGALLGRQAATAVALVLDNSASMGARDRTGPRWERAVAAAGQILDQLGEQDSVALLVSCGPPRPELDRLYRNQQVPRQALDACRLSFEQADLVARLRQARKLLSGSDAPNKEIYVVTDMQEVSWQSLRDRSDKSDLSDSSAPGPVPPADRIPVVLVDVHGPRLPNTALRQLRLDAAAPVTEMPIRVTAQLTGNVQTPQPRHVELHLDGRKLMVSPTLTVSEGKIIEHRFEFSLPQPGLHQGHLQLTGDDACRLDDRLYFALQLAPRISVALVEAGGREISYLRDSFYLQRALRPTSDTQWAIDTTTIAPASLANDALDRYAVIFCVNLPALDASGSQKLLQFVRGGGHVVWICGENVDLAAYGEMNDRAAGRLLPLPVTAVRQASPEQPDGWRIGWLDPSHSALAPLTSPASLYQSVNIYKHVVMQPSGDSAARVLARLSDGQPLLVARQVGHGSVWMLGTSAHVDWSNLPLRPLFMPLVLRLTFYLAGVDATQPQRIAGMPLPLPRRQENQAVEIVRPSGEMVRWQRDSVGASPFRYADTHEVGIYQVTVLGGANGRKTAYAVNIDPAETDARSVSAERLKAQFDPRPLLVCHDPRDIAGTMARLRQGQSLWQPLLIAVLLALVTETFVANRHVQHS